MGNLIEARNRIKTAEHKNSKTLILSNLELTTHDLEQLIPEISQALPELKTLNLMNNDLEELPSNISNLGPLETLVLLKNKLKKLTPELSKLRQLCHLNLNKNELISIPLVIGDLNQLKTLYLNQNEINGRFPYFFKGLTNLEELSISGNFLSPDDHLFLNEELKAKNKNLRVTVDRYDFETLSNTNEVLKDIFGEDRRVEIQAKIERLGKDDTLVYSDANGKILSADKVIEQFLERIPIDHRNRNLVYFDAAKYLLSQVFNDDSEKSKRDEILSTIATALGNCQTPVRNFLTQTCIGMNREKFDSESYSKDLQAILAKKALENAVFYKFKQVKIKGEKVFGIPESSELMQGLLNAVFLKRASDYCDNKIKINFEKDEQLPVCSESNIRVAFEHQNKYPELIEPFAQLCCKTDEQGELLIASNGNYIYDKEKELFLVDKYLTSFGIYSKREKQINKFEASFLELTKSEVCIELATDFMQKEEVESTFNLTKQKDKLRAQLHKVNTEDISREFQLFLENLKSDIEYLNQKYLKPHQNIQQTTKRLLGKVEMIRKRSEKSLKFSRVKKR